MAMNVNNEHCCEIKQYCDYDPSKCQIAKRNKDIEEFEKAKESLKNAIKNSFKIKRMGVDFLFHKKEIKRLSQENEKLRLKNIIISYQQDQYRELLKTYEGLVKAYEAKIQELRNVIKDMKCE